MTPSLKTRLLRPQVVLGVTAGVAALSVLATFLLTAPQKNGSYVHPTQGPITEEVDTTGTIKAADSVDLAFERSGRISYVSAVVGSHVSAGTGLASISAATAQASLEQAKAALQVQQAKLDALQTGARPEDVAVAQAAVSGAESAVSETKQSVLSSARNAYAVSDDAIHNKVDQLFNNPRGASPSLLFTLSDSQLQASVATDRIAMEALLTEWQTYELSLPSNADSISAADVSAKTGAYLLQVSNYLNEVATALTKVVYSTSYTQSTIQGYQANIATARTSVSGAISTQNTAQTAEKSAEAGLVSAQSTLTLKQAPATAQDIAQQVAQVASAQANVDAASAELSKTSLRAPFTGIITKNDAHLGAIATPGAPLISMISDAKFQLEAYVSEADVSKVKVGNTAQITFDAYQTGQALSAHVVAVDPAATVQDGVSAYKVTLQFDTADSRIQAGLTGNARIITETKDSALQVPSSAIVRQGSGTFVLLSTPSGDTLTPVQTGISSADGMTEVLSGVTASDSIRSFGTQQ